MPPEPVNMLASYRSLLDLSEQMVQRARAQDSAALLQLEEGRKAILAALPDPLPALSAAEVAAIRTTIQEIQACDATVLDIVEPWQAQIARLLGKPRPAQ